MIILTGSDRTAKDSCGLDQSTMDFMVTMDTISKSINLKRAILKVSGSNPVL